MIDLPTARAAHTVALRAWIDAHGDDIDRLRPALDAARMDMRVAETLDRLRRSVHIDRHHHVGRWAR